MTNYNDKIYKWNQHRCSAYFKQCQNCRTKVAKLNLGSYLKERNFLLHNKIMFCILFTSLLLLGCSNAEGFEEESTKKLEEELNDDEQFLADLKVTVKEDKESGTSLVIPQVIHGLEKIKDIKIKEQIINIFEESIDKIIEEGDGAKFLEYNFFPKGPEHMVVKDYLKESTIEKIYKRAYPIYYELTEQDLIIVDQDFNKEFKVEELMFRPEISNWFRDNDIDYEYLTNASSYILVLPETGTIVSLTNETGVPSTFTIEDNQGKGINPRDVLKKVDERLIEESRQKSEEFEKEYNAKKDRENQIRERKKEEGPKIGMTDTEILDIFGKPYKINRTTTASSKREQWVYPNNVYLYFENRILVTIQD